MNAQTKINANAEVIFGKLDTSHATLSTLTISETVTVGAEADSLVARLVEQARRKMLEKVAARGTFGLMAVSLAACKSDDGASLTVESGQSVSGLVIKGPLQGAFVFADLNNNGIYSDGEPNATTAADGSYTLSGVANSGFAVIATTSSTTIDSSTGLVLDNVTLKATAGSAVISPITTLIEETGLSASAVATALGVPDGVDVLSFNPYAAGVDAATALSVENLSQQIVATMRGVAAAAEGAGLSRAAASDLAIKAIADVVTTNAGTAGSAALDFSNAATITTIVDAAATAAVTAGADATRMSAVEDALSSAISNVNDKISTVTDLTSTASKAIFATSGTLASEANAAATAGTVGSITLNEAANVDSAATALEDDVEAAAEAAAAEAAAQAAAETQAAAEAAAAEAAAQAAAETQAEAAAEAAAAQAAAEAAAAQAAAEAAEAATAQAAAEAAAAQAAAAQAAAEAAAEAAAAQAAAEAAAAQAAAEAAAAQAAAEAAAA
uniref:hypothetical protein n=1 Tax=Yoonia sp. TaxID=2212373 RepID=UPI0040489992